MQLGMVGLGWMGATGAASRQVQARRDASGQLLNAIGYLRFASTNLPF